MAATILDLLNEASKAEAGIQSKYQNFREIKLNREEIEITKHNKYSMDNLQEMATGIEMAGGIQEPLILGRIEGKYYLASGHRRIAGVDILLEEGKEQFSKIPCRYKEMSWLEFRMHLLIGNLYNRKMTDYDLMMQAEEFKTVITELMDEEKRKAKEENREPQISGRVRDYVCELTGMSAGKVGTLNAINNNATEEIKEQFAEGNIGITGAHAASQLPEEEQREVAEKIKAGDIKSEQIQQMVKEKQEEEREKDTEDGFKEVGENADMQQDEEEDKTVLKQRKETVSDLDTTDQEKENAKRLHALKMLEKYYTWLSDEEVNILAAMLEDCKRRKREYSFD